MKHDKRFKTLERMSPGHDVGYIQGKAKRGKTKDLKSCVELQGLLRDYTYNLIGLVNEFHNIARTYGEFHGSNWRTYKGTSALLQPIANKLNTTSATDFQSILDLEREIEAIAAKLIKEQGR